MSMLALLSVLVGSLAPACSGYPPRHLQHVAHVVVVGRVEMEQSGQGSRQTVVARRVLKGEKRPRYRITWPVVDDHDECAFLLPITRDRGVFFLTRRDDGGGYDVLWTEKRWKMVR